MTTAQNEALKKINELLHEHFDSAVCHVETKGDSTEAERKLCWVGERSTAIGLLEIARAVIVQLRAAPEEL
jgi:hypothetical protein